MPVIKRLAVLLLECAPIWYGILGLEARQPETPRAILASEDCVGPTGPVRLALPRHVKYRS